MIFSIALTLGVGYITAPSPRPLLSLSEDLASHPLARASRSSLQAKPVVRATAAPEPCFGRDVSGPTAHQAPAEASRGLLAHLSLIPLCYEHSACPPGAAPSDWLLEQEGVCGWPRPSWRLLQRMSEEVNGCNFLGLGDLTAQLKNRVKCS